MPIQLSLYTLLLLFFSKSDLAQLLNTAGIFAVGFDEAGRWLVLCGRVTELVVKENHDPHFSLVDVFCLNDCTYTDLKPLVLLPVFAVAGTADTRLERREGRIWYFAARVE